MAIWSICHFWESITTYSFHSFSGTSRVQMSIPVFELATWETSWKTMGTNVTDIWENYRHHMRTVWNYRRTIEKRKKLGRHLRVRLWDDMLMYIYIIKEGGFEHVWTYICFWTIFNEHIHVDRYDFGISPRQEQTFDWLKSLVLKKHRHFG